MRASHRMMVFVVLVALLLGACGDSVVETVIVEVPAEESEVMVVTATPEPTATERALTGPRATAAALSAGVTLSPPTAEAEEEGSVAPDDYVAIVQYAWDIVAENYVRDNFNGVDWDAMLSAYLERAEGIASQEELWNVLDEMIAELGDNHSRFVRPDDFGLEFDALDPSEALEGVQWTGLVIWPAREDEAILIWDVCSFGPAANAGLLPGDIVLGVNGTPVEIVDGDYDHDLIRAAQRGQAGRVELLIQQGPDAEPRTVELSYGAAGGCPGWELAILSNDPYIGYLRIPDFGGDTATNVLDAIELFEEEQPLEGLVLDVRHNPGGNSDRTIRIFTSGVFGLVGPLREDGTQTTYRIRGPVEWNETTPVVVLTDGSSHSAAEYFATAMQQSGRATILGMPTAGNTEGITGFSLPDGSLIRLAVMTLQLPDGSTLEGVGVQPDIEVPLGAWGRRGADVQVQAALQYLLGSG